MIQCHYHCSTSLIKWFEPKPCWIPHKEAYICSGVLCPQSIPKPLFYFWKNSWAHVLLCFPFPQSHMMLLLPFKDRTDIILHNGWKYLQRGETMFYFVTERCRVILTIRPITQWWVNVLIGLRWKSFTYLVPFPSCLVFTLLFLFCFWLFSCCTIII